MKLRIQRHWKPLLSGLSALAVFLACQFPFRAVLHLHEQQHLFRWTGYYLREQLAAGMAGWWELMVSFVTQFFYYGWLGAAVMALLIVACQAVTWWLLRLCRLRRWWAYVLSFVPAGVLFCEVFIPRQWKDDSLLREAAEYDYLVRAQRWDAILWKSYGQTPETTNAVWCANYALAKKGMLLQRMFDFYQQSPDGLLLDAGRMEPLSLHSMSDIMMDLGLVNNAERMAFDAMVQLPDNHKSGRLCKRLAEANLVNGSHDVARKYLHFLESTLFYGRWARERLRGKPDERLEELKRLRTTSDTLLSYSIGHALERLVADHPDNLMARDYLLAYEMLRLDHERVLNLARRFSRGGHWQAPKAVQECVAGYWMLTHHEGDSLPMPIEKSIYDNTLQFMQIVSQTGDMHHPSLDRPPHNHSYWNYQARAKALLSRKP